MTDARLQPVRLLVSRSHCGEPVLERVPEGSRKRKGVITVASFVAERWLRTQEAWWIVVAQVEQQQRTEGGVA